MYSNRFAKNKLLNLITVTAFVAFFTQSLCECRCKLIEQQRRICSSEIIDMEKMTASFQMILRNLPRQATKSTPLVKSVVRELELWCIITKTYISFGKLGYVLRSNIWL